MAILGGVGRSHHRQSNEAGRLAALDAHRSLGSTPADMVLVFASTGFDQQDLIDGVSSVFADVPMSGCSGEGIIAGDVSDEGSHAVAVMAIASDTAELSSHLVENLSRDSSAAGLRLVEGFRIRDRADPALVMLFPDGLTGNFSQLLRSVDEGIGAAVPIVGGASGDMMRFTETYQYHDGRVFTDSVAAVVISGPVRADVVVSHGCDLIGPVRTVTRGSGCEIEQLDGRAAWDVFRQYLDSDVEDVNSPDATRLSFAHFLSVPNLGYGDFIVRTPMSIQQGTGALRFGAEFNIGDKVSLVRRTPHRVRESTVRASERLRELQAGRSALAFSFDCAGRGRVLFGRGTDAMVVEPVRRALGMDVPLIGFHTFGEIAKSSGRTHYHNYTVALCALCELEDATP